jgi:hypothetical protein
MVHRLIYAVVFGLLAVGCQSAEEPAATTTTATGIDASEIDSTIATPTSSDSPSTASPAPDAVAQDAAKFEPPFPGRTELFAPPRRGPSTIRRDDEHGGTVELKGFVDVNGPQAVLSIDGVISPIPAGGEKYGVQVISIKPPQAVLQRGRNRWTASVE